MSASSSERIDQAFDLLRSTVEELHSGGRRIYSAGLKPELKRRSAGGFDEKTLNGGFVSFKRFLEAAQARGIVDLVPAPAGPDVLVTPHGAKPADVVATAGAATAGKQPGVVNATGGRFIRREFWRAFIDWREDEVRVYDARDDAVRRFPPEPVPLEPPEQTERRRLWREEPERFHQITPITPDRQLEWMRTFASSAAEPMRTALVLALSNDKPFRGFSLAARVDPATNARWQTERVRHVAEEIEGWASDAGIEPQIFEPSLNSVRVGTTPARRQPAAQSHDDDVRRKVHAAVERMPLSALYALSIPVEYLIDA